MSEHKVSIVIPVYNGEDYVREAIDSALNQTYDNIEVIVVNDGSTDNTDEIAKSYGDRIIYIKKENGGVSTALNLAIEKMTGEYFSWLSHDDRYYPQKVEREIEYLEENSLFGKNVIVFSDYDLMDEKSHVFATSIKDHMELVEKPEYSLLRGSINGLTLLIPKQAFIDCGNFRIDLSCVQDYELWSRMMRNGYEFIHIPEVLVAMRMHSRQQGNTSPFMLSEGNELWINLINQTDKATRNRLEGSEDIFMEKMHKFMLTTPYGKATEFAKNEFERIRAERISEEQYIKITVAIPFSGMLDLVYQSVESVRNQTYSNVELLLIDVNSNEPLSRLNELVCSLPCARIIKCEGNSSMADACNIAINEAVGEYIAFLGPCDTFSPEKIEYQLIKMVIGASDFSHTDYFLNDLDNSTEEKVLVSHMSGKPITDIIIDRRIAFSTVMIKTDFLRKNNLAFKDSFMYGGDICFFIECLKMTELLSVPKMLSHIYRGGDTYRKNSDYRFRCLKTVLAYVLSDHELAKYEYQITRLAAEYISFYYNENVNTEILESLFGRLSPPKRSILRRTLSAIKHRGIVHTVRAGLAKIKRRLVQK